MAIIIVICHMTSCAVIVDHVFVVEGRVNICRAVGTADDRHRSSAVVPFAQISCAPPQQIDSRYMEVLPEPCVLFLFGQTELRVAVHRCP